MKKINNRSAHFLKNNNNNNNNSNNGKLLSWENCEKKIKHIIVKFYE